MGPGNGQAGGRLCPLGQCSGLSNEEESLVKGKTSGWREGDQIVGWAEVQVQEELRPGWPVVCAAPAAWGSGGLDRLTTQ